MTDWKANLGRLKRLTERLDGYRQADTEVFPIAHANAKHLVQTLDDVLGDSGNTATVVADARANAVVAFGTRRQRRQVATLIERWITPRITTPPRRSFPSAMPMPPMSPMSWRSGQQRQRIAGDTDRNGSTGSEAADTTESQAGSQSLPATPSGSGLDGVAFAVHPSSNALVLSGPPSALEAIENSSRASTRAAPR